MFNSNEAPEVKCFGQILGTLYYHLDAALEDNIKYEILNLQINEDKKVGIALVKMSNIIQNWYFDTNLDIWIIEED